MTRYYCDGCGKEMMNGEGNNLEGNAVGRLAYETQIGGNKIGVEVLVSFNGTWNAGIVCMDCVRKIVADSAHTPGPKKKASKR